MDSQPKIDNFQVELVNNCPRKFQYRVKEARTRRGGGSAALVFGSGLHAGLAAMYSGEDDDGIKLAVQESWDDSTQGILMDGDDHRTFDRCIQVIGAYKQFYSDDNFKVVGMPDAPMVEVAYKLDTGLGFDYTGIFDTVIERNGELYILEHKTTSQLGATFFNQFKPNSQVTGYIWAASRILSRPVRGAIINAIGVLKRENKFERHLTTRTDAEIAEWMANTASSVAEIARCTANGHFPQRTTACVGKYGSCEFHSVCSLSDAKTRSRFLEQEFVVNPWDPEHRDKKNVAEPGVQP